MADFDTIVIGSGAGGLTAALALARAGQRVLVLEQHYLPGGWCHSFSLEGFRFSPGVHYIGELGPGGRMRHVWEGLGLGDDLSFYELNPDGYDHVIVGDRRFDIPAGREQYADRLAVRFPSDALAARRYIDVVYAMGRELGDLPTRLSGLASMPRNCPTILRHGFRSLDGLLDACDVRDPFLRTILSIQAGDHGMTPDRAPAVLHAAIADHYFEGGWYPKGGARSIPRAYIRALRKHGGELRVRSSVTRILTEGRRAIGVQLSDGTEIRAHRVVSNADPHATFGLVDPALLTWKQRLRLRATRYSISAVSLFLATDLDMRAAGMDSGNCWYSAATRVADTYDYARTLGQGDLPGLFLTCTTLKDPLERRDGRHTLEAFAFVDWKHFESWGDTDHERRPHAYQALKDNLTEKILDRVQDIVPGIRDHILLAELGTPVTNQFYAAATRGSLYGTEKSWAQLTVLAQSQKTEIEDLWMCGASTTGHGVMGAVYSGLTVAGRIMRCSTREFLGSDGGEIRTLSAEGALGSAPNDARV